MVRNVVETASNPRILFGDRSSKHRELRKRVSKAYSMSYILEMEHFVDKLVAQFKNQMIAHEGEIIDMADWAQYFAFDVVGELAFGRAFGFLQHGRDFNGLLDAVYCYVTATAALGFTWNKAQASYYRLVQWVLNNSYLKRLGKSVHCNPRIPLENV